MLLMILVLWFLCKIKQNSFLDIFFLLTTFLLKRYRKEKFIFGHSWEQKYWLVDCLTKYHWTTKGRKDEWLDWLVECLTDWLRLSKWLTEKSTDCPVLLTDWLTSCLSDQSTSRPPCLTDWLIDWWIDSLIICIINLSTEFMIEFDRLTNSVLIEWLMDWLTDLLAHWLTDSLTYQLTDIHLYWQIEWLVDNWLVEY